MALYPGRAPFWPGYVREIPWKFRIPQRARSFQFLVDCELSRWMRALNGKVRFGRTPLGDVQFQGEGAHRWQLGRRGGLARGIYHRLPANGRFSIRANLSEVQFCADTMVSREGIWAYQMAFGS